MSQRPFPADKISPFKMGHSRSTPPGKAGKAVKNKLRGDGI